MSKRIQLDYLTRIEGHAHLVIDRQQGKLIDCHLEVVETPRFFEALLQGRHYTDIATIVSRVWIARSRNGMFGAPPAAAASF